MIGRVASVNAAPEGGVPKPPVATALVTGTGLATDKQRNRKLHGGPDRAVCLFSLERIEALQHEGHPIRPGSTGDNLTLQGLAWDKMVPGVQLKIGPEVLLEVVSYTAPCRTIRESFAGEDFTRISQKLHPGWSRLYARVLKQGSVRVGDEVSVVVASGLTAGG